MTKRVAVVLAFVMGSKLSRGRIQVRGRPLPACRRGRPLRPRADDSHPCNL